MRCSQVLLESHWVLIRARRRRDNLASRLPRLSTVSASAQKNVNRAPIAASRLASLAISQQGTLRRDDDAGYPKVCIAQSVRLEDVDLLKERYAGTRGRLKHYRENKSSHQAGDACSVNHSGLLFVDLQNEGSTF